MRDISRVMVRAWQLTLWFGPAVTILCAGLAYWSAQRGLLGIDDDDLAVATERAATVVDMYMARVVNDLTAITTNPQVRALAARGSARPPDVAKERAMDKDWRSPADQDDGFEPTIRALLRSDISTYLDGLVHTTGTVIREVALTDRAGRLIAASDRTDDYIQNDDDPWWPKDLQGFQSCPGAPIACAQFGDVRWDASAGAFGLDVVMPVVSAGMLVGVMKTVVDPSELRSVMRMLDLFLDVMVLRKIDGVPILDQMTNSIVSSGPPQESLAVPALPQGGQTLIHRSDGTHAIHALSGPMGKFWIVAASAHVRGESRRAWIPPAIWLTLTLVALLLTAASRSIREAGAADVAPRPGAV